MNNEILYEFDLILLLSIVILSILLLYTFYTYIKKRVDAFSVKDIQKSINEVGNLGKTLGDQISKVKELGIDVSKLNEDIEQLSSVPDELAAQVKEELSNIVAQASDEITNAANSAFNEIDDAANEVNGVASNSINQIWKSLNKISNEIDNIPDQVEDMATNIFLEWIPMIFDELGAFFIQYVLDPIAGVFEEIGGIFEAIGVVFEEILKALIKIPMCIPIYMFDATYDGVLWGLDKIFPSWLKGIISFINNFIIKPIIIPIITFFLMIIKTIMELIGFKFDLNYYMNFRTKCYNLGPLTLVINIFKDLFTEVFDGISKLFKNIPFDLLLDEIMKLFQTGN